MASTKNLLFKLSNFSKVRYPSWKKPMPRLILLLLSVLSLNSFGFSASQANTTQPARAQDHVIIQRRRIVLVRSRELAKQFPNRKTAILTYPVISGLSDPVVSRRVRSALDFKNIFDYSLKEYREDAWLSEFSYVVNYNSNYLLDITFNQSGMGAYPDEQSKHFLINLRNGSVIKASDAFQSDRLQELAAAVDRKLQAELKQIDKENSEPNAEQPDEKAVRREAYEALKFEVQNLDEFSVGRKGITFLYDAGFPHVIRALEPNGRYLFTYTQLKPFIKPDGPLGQFVR